MTHESTSSESTPIYGAMRTTSITSSFTLPDVARNSRVKAADFNDFLSTVDGLNDAEAPAPETPAALALEGLGKVLVTNPKAVYEMNDHLGHVVKGVLEGGEPSSDRMVTVSIFRPSRLGRRIAQLRHGQDRTLQARVESPYGLFDLDTK